MNRIILFIMLIMMLISTLFAKNCIESVEDDLYYLNHKLTKEQFEIMKRVWKYAKLYNLQWTAVSIAWQESHFGKWRINSADPSCGIFHQLLPELNERLGIKVNRWNNDRRCEDLLDFDYAFKTFVDTFHIKEQICYVRGYKRPDINWKCAVMAYNGWLNRSYYYNVVNKIKALKIWLEKNKINLNH
jgi:hypothetical protein